MAKRIRFPGISNTYFITFVVKKHTPLFKIDEIAELLKSTLLYYLYRGDYKIHGYVIMPDHVHLLLTLSGEHKIGHTVGRIKSYFNYLIQKNELFHKFPVIKNVLDNNKNKIWESKFDDKTVANEKLFHNCLNYIHNNPVKANLADNPEDYKYSSAIWYG